MTGIEALCRMIGGLEVTEVERWIGEAWVLPHGERGAYVFEEVDVARVRLIVELRRELAIDDEAMPVVLNLMDQLYAMRRRLRAMQGALASLPPELRASLAAHLSEAEEG